MSATKELSNSMKFSTPQYYAILITMQSENDFINIINEHKVTAKSE